MADKGSTRVAAPAGLAWLIEHFGLRVPAPAVRSETIAGARRTVVGNGQVLEQYPAAAGYAPKGLFGHLRLAAIANTRGGTSSRGACATRSPAPRRRAGGAGEPSGRPPRTSCRRAGPRILRSRHNLGRGLRQPFRISAAEADRSARRRRRSRRMSSTWRPAARRRGAVASVSSRLLPPVEWNARRGMRVAGLK